MKYMGSKYLLKQIVEFIENRHKPEGRWVEPFAGALGSAARVTKHDTLVLNDISPGLMNLFEQVRNGRLDLPDEVSQERYNKLKELRADDPLSVFISFACSWGGKQWGGYARGGVGREHENYARDGKRLIAKKLKALEGKEIKFSQVDYKDVSVLPGDIVYCDPPYENTTRYKSGDFDHSEFWKWAEKLSKTNHVYVSEFKGRDGWDTVWQKERPVHTSKDCQVRKTELLLYRGPNNVR